MLHKEKTGYLRESLMFLPSRSPGNLLKFQSGFKRFRVGVWGHVFLSIPRWCCGPWTGIPHSPITDSIPLCHLSGGHSSTAQYFILLTWPVLQAKSLLWRERIFNSEAITFLIGKSFAEKRAICWVVGIAQWKKAYLAWTEPGLCPQSCRKMTMVSHTCNPSTWMEGTGKLGVQGDPYVYRKFKPNLGYMRPCQ